MRVAIWAFGLLLCVGGCSAGGGGAASDGGLQDGVYEVSLDLPPGCPPDAGNEKGVGTPCTRGGGQCKGNLRCTCDPQLGALLVGVPCFCTLAQFAQTGSTDPCGPPLPASYCGSNATCCAYLTAAAYCVPSICLPDNMCIDFTAGP